MPAKTKIGILIHGSSDYLRELRRGITDCVREHGDAITEVYHGGDSVAWLRAFDGAGVIAQVARPDERAYLRRQRSMKVVNVSGWFAEPGLPTVAPDDEAVGRVAAEFFHERGYEQLAYFGIPGPAFARRRGQAFIDAARVAGLVTHDFQTDIDAATDPDRAWDEAWRRGWLADLPRPTGLFAVADDHGRTLVRLCDEIGIDVPEDLAVLGVNNDELVCEMTRPQLSSIDLRLRQLGHRAAAMLFQQIDGRPIPTGPTHFPPGQVIERGSTRASGVDDPALAQALNFIRDHAADGVGVDDVLDHVRISRRSLELKFRDHLDTSPWKAIQLARIRRAQSLLTETDLSIARIAELSGFESSYQFSVMFKRRVGDSPTDYRASHRSRT